MPPRTKATDGCILTNNITRSLTGEAQENIRCEILKHVYLPETVGNQVTLIRRKPQKKKRAYYRDFPNIAISVRDHTLDEEKE
jgi:hypothetical protein